MDENVPRRASVFTNLVGKTDCRRAGDHLFAKIVDVRLKHQAKKHNTENCTHLNQDVGQSPCTEEWAMLIYDLH